MKILILLLIYLADAALGHVVVKNAPNSKLDRLVKREDERISHVSRNNAKVCETEKCRELAGIIQRSVNKSADPCKDFSEYACGGWPTNFPVPPGQQQWSLDDIVQEKITNIARRLWKEEIKSTDPVPHQLGKKWYQACMNLDAIREVGIEPLINMMDKIGGWPLITENWDSAKHTWQNVQKYYVNITGKFDLFDIGIEVNDKNSSKSSIHVDQPSIHLYTSVEYSSGNATELVLIYGNFLNSVAHTFMEAKGISNRMNGTKLKNDITDILIFGTALLEIKLSEEERLDRDRLINFMTIEELQQYYNRANLSSFNSKIDWLDDIQTLFQGTNVHVDESEVIEVYGKDYLYRLVELLDKTPSDVIVNYIHWINVFQMMEYTTIGLTPGFLELRVGKENYERENYCAADVPFPLAVSYEFIKQNITDDMIEMVRDVAENIRNEIEMEIKTSKWLDNETKALVVEKLQTMTVNIGYPEWYKNESAVNHFYDGVEVGPHYFDNMINYLFNDKKKMCESLRTPYNKNKWLMEPTEINAYYNPSANSLAVPAAAFVTPYVDTMHSKAIVYGSLGFFLGHEMTHGFDATGRKYDKDGNFGYWWSNDTYSIYKEKVQCIVDQFNNYSTNGYLTNEENTADNGGLRAAYGVYKKLSPETDLILPGLEEYTSDQLFFISFALTFCESRNETSEKNDETSNAESDDIIKLDEDVHSSAATRILGTVANIESFGEAFHCSANSEYNKRDKCTIW